MCFHFTTFKTCFISLALMIPLANFFAYSSHLLRIESDLDSELCLTTQQVCILRLYSFQPLESMNSSPKALRVLPGRIQVFKSLNQRGFPQVPHKGGRLASQSLVHWGLPVRGLDWAKANFRTMNGGSITLGLDSEGQGGH